MFGSAIKLEDFPEILDSVTVGIVLIDTDGKIVMSNKSGAMYSGIPYDTCVGEFFPYDVRENPYEVEIQRGDGSNGIASLSFAKTNNKSSSAVAMITDITEFRKSRDVLARSEAKFRALAETTPDAIFIHRGNNYIYVNPTMTALTGFTEEELLKHNFLEMVEKNFWPEITDPSGKKLRVGTEQKRYELQIIKKDGSLLWVVVSFTLIIYEGVMAVLGVLMDITDKKKAEEALAENEKKYRTYIDTSPEGFIVFDDNFKIIEANIATHEMLKAEARSLVYKNLLDFVDQSNREKISKQVEVLKQTGKVSLEFKLINSKRDTIDITFEGAKFEEGQYLAFMNDITYKKNAEKQMQQSEKLAGIGSLVAGVAHEINNPLAVMKGNMFFLREMLHDHFDKENKSFEILDKLEKSSKRIASIVDGLRMYARTDSDEIDEIDVHLAVEETILLVEGVYKHEKISLESNLLATNTAVIGNSGKFMQVLMNFISNAKDAYASKGGGLVTIKTYNKENKICIEVEDKGCGIAEENIAKIFDAFFTTKDPGKGTGLGLSITASIIQTMGGIIDVDSKLGVGTTIRVTLPCARVIKAEGEVDSKKLKGKVIVVKSLNSEITIDKELGSLGLETVVSINSIEEVISKIKANVFDFMFVDLKIQEIEKLITETKNIGTVHKILALTGGIEIPREKREQYRVWFDGYIRKAFSQTELFNTLTSYMKKS